MSTPAPPPVESAAPPDTGPRRALVERPVALAVLLTAAIAIAFLPAVVGEFLWDDVLLVRSNAYVQDLSLLGDALLHDFWHVSSQAQARGAGLVQRYYRPVVTVAYALQYRAFGDRPLGFHLVSVALHAACSLLVFGWLRRRLGASPRAILPALLGAAMFALHPSRPESVAWISGSTDLWMTLWVLLGLRAWDRDPTPGTAARTALCFVLAACSKEVAVVAPALLAVDLLLLPHAGSGRGPRWRALGVVACASALALIARAVVLHGLVPPNTRELPAMMPVRVLSTLGHYTSAVLWPWHPSVQLALQHSDPRGRPMYEPWSVVVGGLLAAALVGVAAQAWRSPRWRPWLADALWFVVALAPTMNIVPLGMNVLVAMRFLYLPLLGVAALLARALLAADPTRVRVPALAASLATLLALGWVTTDHAGHFVGPDELWSHELRLNPCNRYALEQVSSLQMQRGQWERIPATQQRVFACALQHGDGSSAVRAMVSTAEFLLWTTPDRDQATLTAVRSFFDAFVTVPSGQAQLVTRDLRMSFPLRPHEAPLRRAMKLEASRAYSHFRTWRFAAAERQLRALAGDPLAFSARRYLAMTLAAQERWDESLSILDRFTVTTPEGPEARALAAQVTATRAVLVGSVADPVRVAVARAELFTALGLGEQARRQLRPALVASPERFEPLEALVLVELHDHREDAAREVLAESRRRFPTEGARWEALSRRRALSGRE